MSNYRHTNALALPPAAVEQPAPAANDNAAGFGLAPRRGGKPGPLAALRPGRHAHAANDNAAPRALGAFAAAALAVAAGTAAPARADITGAPVAVELPIVPMGMVSGDISRFPKWAGLLQRYALEKHIEDAPCQAASCPLQDWRAHLRGLAGKEPMRQLRSVNEYVNRTPYQTDLSRYGTNDYWATPREFLGKAGDCEDYAITKYLSLRKLGWPARALRIVILSDSTRRELHAVLVAELDGIGYALDNLSEGVRPMAALRHYRPIFSINELGWEQHRAPLATLPLPHIGLSPELLKRFAVAAVALPAPSTAAGAAEEAGLP